MELCLTDHISLQTGWLNKYVTTQRKNETYKIVIANTHKHLLCAIYHSKWFAWNNLLIHLNYPMMYYFRSTIFYRKFKSKSLWNFCFVCFSQGHRSDLNWYEAIYSLGLYLNLNIYSFCHINFNIFICFLRPSCDCYVSIWYLHWITYLKFKTFWIWNTLGPKDFEK